MPNLLLFNRTASGPAPAPRQALVRAPYPWINQPPVGVPLNPAYPLAKGLQFFSSLGDDNLDLGGRYKPSLVNAPSRYQDQFGRARSLNGSSQYVDLNNGSDPTLSNISLLCCFRLASVPANPMLIARDSDSGGRAFTFDLDSSTYLKIRFYVNGGGGGIGTDITRSDNSISISAGVDYIALATFDGAHGAIYLNGVRVTFDPFTTPIPSATTSTRVGSRAYSGFEGYFPGIIRYAAIWNYAIDYSRAIALTQSLSSVFAFYRLRTQRSIFLPAPAAAARRFLGIPLGVLNQ